MLWDTKQALERLQRYTAGKSFTDYDSDDYLRSAVERQFEIIGEALNHLARIDPMTAALIPELPRIVSFRNVLIHAYASVDNRMVWGILLGRVPQLHLAVQNLLTD